MREYIGTKMIKAEPQAKNGKEGYKVVYEDSYVSWSPKDIFEKFYKESCNLTFGIALELLKKGKKIARKGWNGKDMFVVYQKGYPNGIPCNIQTANAWKLNEGDLFKCEPYLQIKMVNGSHAMWVPSINDVLSEDWEVVDD